jgi:hypothetical protein
MYVEALAPVGRGIDIKMGKMTALTGLEVIESKDNWFYSHSFLYTFAMPHTVTGLRASTPVVDGVTVTAGVNNGWDQTNSGLYAKTGEFQVSATPNEMVEVHTNVVYGAQDNPQLLTPFPPFGITPAQSGRKRVLEDVTVLVKPTDKVEAGINWQNARQRDTIIEPSGEVRPARWTGLGGIGRVQLLEWFAPSARLEYYRDSDGLRTITLANQPVTLRELTVTGEFRVGDHFIFRLEIRHDSADARVFVNGSSPASTQNTGAVETIFVF